jgi:lipopolysaccharide/colanic/teichoic acid biosynthesis glycosyltransferase
MSLIGPRPCLKYEYDHFDDWHKERFKIKPGMTGMWQVFGRNNSDVTFNDSIIMDLYYIHNYSLWLDFKIVLKTIPTVLFGKGGV